MTPRAAPFLSRALLNEAWERVNRELHITPLQPLRWLSNDARETTGKLETRQIMGSFKARGAIARMREGDLDGFPGGVVADGFNHGIAVAWAGALMDIPISLVLSPKVPPTLVRRAREMATVIPSPSAQAAGRAAFAQRYAEARQAFYLSPEDPLVIAGNGATLAREILEASPECDAIVVPVGSGNLAAGVARYLELENHKEVQLIAAEGTRAALTLGDSPYVNPSGEVSELSQPLTLYLETLTRRIDLTLTLGEAPIRAAMAEAFKATGEAIQGAAALGLAAVQHEHFPADIKRPCVLITGRNIDRRQFDQILEQEMGPRHRMENR